jgi:hypothetical protein
VLPPVAAVDDVALEVVDDVAPVLVAAPAVPLVVAVVVGFWGLVLLSASEHAWLDMTPAHNDATKAHPTKFEYLMFAPQAGRRPRRVTEPVRARAPNLTLYGREETRSRE